MYIKRNINGIILKPKSRMHTKISNITTKIITKECKAFKLIEKVEWGEKNEKRNSIQKKGGKLGTQNKQH